MSTFKAIGLGIMCFCALGGSMLAARSALAVPPGDATAGEDVYASECSDCHSLKKGKNKKGPSFFGVVGRHSASIANFNYSDAMRAANKTWTPDEIDAYITHPKKVIPGGKMKYDGLSDAKERADLLAFLATLK